MNYQEDLFNQNKKPYNPHYFNTTGLKGEELKKKELKVTGQNAQILEVFANNPNVSFTPCEIYHKFKMIWPLTSVRRSISTLTKDDYLVKTDVMRQGIYGEPNHTWMLNPNKE